MMTTRPIDRIILALLNIGGIGRKRARDIAAAMFREGAVPEDLGEFLACATDRKFIRARYSNDDLDKALSHASRIEEQLVGMGGGYVSFMSGDFPSCLNAINDPPTLIFFRGNTALLQADASIGVVGTREPTPYAAKAGDRVVEILAKAGYNIISGLAVGCDTIAHRAAISHGGKTLAVLPSGFLSIYPQANISLALEILEHDGLWVSEYLPLATARKNFFVERDRLQSALSRALIVLETETDGATMHTVRFALRERKPIACLLTHPAEYLSAPTLQGNLFIEHEKWGVAIRDEHDLDVFLRSLS